MPSLKSFIRVIPYLLLLQFSLLIYAERILPQEDLDNDIRITFIPDILQSGGNSHFKILSSPNSYGYTTVEPYQKEKVIFVSAVNTLLKLDASNLNILQRHTWEFTEKEIAECHRTSPLNKHCGKYHVKLILLRNVTVHKDVLFVCHTNGTAPICSERNADNITTLNREWNAESRHYPIDPDQNITALIASDGHLYLGSVAGQYGRRSVITRKPMEGASNRKKILNTRFTMKWLQMSEPVSFINSFEFGSSVFFIFRELAEEYEISCKEKVMLSRIARVCKDDQGNLQMNNQIWTSFAKASLICPTDGAEGKRIFGIIQSASIDKERGIVTAIFTTQESGPAGSVLCEYTINSIEQVFKGPYFEHKIWKPSPKNSSQTCSVYKSGNRQALSSIYQEGEKYQLMYQPILPISNKYIIRKDFERWYHLLVDHVIRGGHTHKVYFVATSRGSIRKLMPLHDRVCELEEIFLDRYQTVVINDMKATWEKPMQLIVSTNNSVFRIPSERCYRLGSEMLCSSANDPYCYWDTQKQACLSIDRISNADHLSRIFDCSKLVNIPIDGAWNTWTPWSPCQFNHWKAKSSGNNFERGPDSCLCRTRSCDSPRPLAGGSVCQGESAQVSQCNGWWGSWNDWSDCSKSCGHGMRTRTRKCLSMNGELADCKGENSDKKPCLIIPKCPSDTSSIAWSDWGKWSRCEHQCSDGYQKRHRSCEPLYDQGQVCTGNNFEIRKCLNDSCPEQVTLSRWTEWLDLSTSTNFKKQRRYRASCVGRALDLKSITAEVLLAERPCKDSSCKSTDGRYENSRYEAWSEWSGCSKLCGGGVSTRRRECLQPLCNAFIEERPCNTQKCRGQWSCWGDWSSCSVDCGTGVQKRVRLCKDIEGSDSTDCKMGDSAQQRQCGAAVKCRKTTGWSVWETWSECSHNYQRVRRRQCLGEQPHAVTVEELCFDEDKQIETCLNPSLSAASRFQDSDGFQLIHIVAVGCVSFLLGAALIIIIMLILYKFRRKTKTNSKSDKTTKATCSSSNLDGMGLIDGDSSVYHPGTSSVPPTPQRKMEGIYRDSPWFPRSSVDDSGLMPSKSGWGRDGLMASLDRSYNSYHAEPNDLHNTTYNTMPLRLESNSGMSTFGRSSKRSQPTAHDSILRNNPRRYMSQFSEPIGMETTVVQNKL